MELKIALEEKKFDKRILDRLLAEGKITQKEVDEQLSKLVEEKNFVAEKE